MPHEGQCGEAASGVDVHPVDVIIAPRRDGARVVESSWTLEVRAFYARIGHEVQDHGGIPISPQSYNPLSQRDP